MSPRLHERRDGDVESAVARAAHVEALRDEVEKFARQGERERRFRGVELRRGGAGSPVGERAFDAFEFGGDFGASAFVESGVRFHAPGRAEGCAVEFGERGGGWVRF